MYPNIRAYILQNSGTEPEAKDVFQEALLAAWMKVQENKFEGNVQDFEGFIFVIAKNKWLDCIKSKHKRSTSTLNNSSIIADSSLYEEIDTRKLLQTIKN